MRKKASGGPLAAKLDSPPEGKWDRVLLIIV
jgi:hypothetical protein